MKARAIIARQPIATFFKFCCCFSCGPDHPDDQCDGWRTNRGISGRPVTLPLGQRLHQGFGTHPQRQSIPHGGEWRARVTQSASFNPISNSILKNNFVTIFELKISYYMKSTDLDGNQQKTIIVSVYFFSSTLWRTIQSTRTWLQLCRTLMVWQFLVSSSR